MRKIEKATNGFTKKHFLNSRNGTALQDIDSGDIISVKHAAQIFDDNGGEEKTVTVLIDEQDQYFTAISSSIYRSTEDLIDIIDDESKPVKVRIDKRTSKSNRDFLTMFIL